MHFQAVGAWLKGLGDSNYAGTTNWLLPDLADLETLYAHLDLAPGNPASL